MLNGGKMELSAFFNDLRAGVALILGLCVSLDAHAIQFMKFQNLTLDANYQVAPATLKQAIKDRANGMSNGDLLKAALNGNLGACTYADAVGPISAVAWGFIKVGKDRSQQNQLSMSGPKVNGKATSGIVFKAEIRNLLRSSIKNLYGGSNATDRITQVGEALRVLVNDSADPCKIDTYATKLATEMNNLSSIASNMANVIHKKSGGLIVPSECAVRLNKVPVKNLSLYLDSTNTSGGCAYPLRIMPERFCEFIYVSDRPNITGVRALTDTKFNQAVGLTSTLNGIDPKKLAALTNTVPSNIGAKTLLDLNVEHSAITGWVDPVKSYDDTFEATWPPQCHAPPDPVKLRACSFTGFYNGSPCTGNYAVPVVGADVQKILKLWHTYKSTVPGDANQTPLQAINSNSKLKQMLDYYSAVAGGGNNNLLAGDIQGLASGTVNDLGTATLPLNPAFQARRFPIDAFLDIDSIDLQSGTTPVIKGPSGGTLSVAQVDCDSPDPGTAQPRPMDLLGDVFAPFPVKPTEAGATWAPNEANLQESLQAFTNYSSTCGP